MEEWKEYRLGDVAIIKGGKRLPKGIELISNPNTHPYIRISDMYVNKTMELTSSYRYVDNNTFNKIKNYIVNSGDVILAIVGNTIGLVAVIGKSLDNANLTENCVKIIANKEVSQEYIYYYLTSIYGQNKIKKGIVGAAQPKLPIKNIISITISAPSKELQERTTNILSSLDDKIELNRRINENLEQQAQALFKSWFVDFEPFKDGKFVDSELGKIPEGWKVVHADEVFDINIGKTPPRKESIWFSNSGSSNVQWVSISDMGNCGAFIGNSKEHLTQDAINKFNIIIVPKDTILLSFKLTIGRVAIAQKELTTNEAIARFYLPYSQYREFTYLTLKNYDYSKLGSTSSIATAVNSKIIKGMKILLPINEHIKNFSTIVKPIFDLMESYSNEIDSLSQLHDTLLPRLMSGELKITDIVDKSLNE